jgi:hypothetical protein
MNVQKHNQQQINIDGYNENVTEVLNKLGGTMGLFQPLEKDTEGERGEISKAERRKRTKAKKAIKKQKRKNK